MKGYNINWTEKLGPDINHKKVLAKRLQTETFKKIAEELHVSAGSVQHYCKRLGIETRRYNLWVNWEEKLKSYPGGTTREKLKNLHHECSFQKMGELLGIGSHSIRREMVKERVYIPQKNAHRVHYNYLQELNEWKSTKEGKEFSAEHPEFEQQQRETR